MTQLFYRIGDSATNAFTPVSAYIWIMLKEAQEKYDPNIKIGKLTSSLLSIGIILLFFWIIFLWLWMRALLRKGAPAVYWLRQYVRSFFIISYP